MYFYENKIQVLLFGIIWFSELFSFNLFWNFQWLHFLLQFCLTYIANLLVLFSSWNIYFLLFYAYLTAAQPMIWQALAKESYAYIVSRKRFNSYDWIFASTGENYVPLLSLHLKTMWNLKKAIFRIAFCLAMCKRLLKRQNRLPDVVFFHCLQNFSLLCDFCSKMLKVIFGYSHETTDLQPLHSRKSLNL